MRFSNLNFWPNWRRQWNEMLTSRMQCSFVAGSFATISVFDENRTRTWVGAVRPGQNMMCTFFQSAGFFGREPKCLERKNMFKKWQKLSPSTIIQSNLVQHLVIYKRRGNSDISNNKNSNVGNKVTWSLTKSLIKNFEVDVMMWNGICCSDVEELIM